MARGINDERTHSDRAPGEGVCIAKGAKCVGETPRAIFVVLEGEGNRRSRELTLPKSQVHDDSEVFSPRADECGPGKLVVTQWLADKEGWTADE